MLKADVDVVLVAMTYSIVARDPESGELGVAVATCWPGVGAVVPWLEPGVGVVVSQAFTNIELGPAGLALLRAGRPPREVVRELVASDPERDLRQLGLVDAAGGSAAYTGSGCVAEADHVFEAGISIQGNMLERVGTPQLMLDAFGGTSGDLAERLMAALDAADREGGDIRGRQSAALLVAPGSAEAAAWERRFDLRVDTSPQPLQELARSLRVARAYEALRAALAESRSGDLRVALAGTAAAHELAPDEAQIAFWHGVVLSANGAADEARPLLETALRSEPRLADYAERYVAAGHGGPLAQTLREVRRLSRG